MVLRRLLYGLTLLGVLLFHITNENYLGQFLLALCLALPLLSLALSLQDLWFRGQEARKSLGKCHQNSTSA